MRCIMGLTRKGKQLQILEKRVQQWLLTYSQLLIFPTGNIEDHE